MFQSDNFLNEIIGGLTNYVFCICNILDDAAEIHLATIFPYCTEEMTGQSPLVRTGHALNELLIVMRSLYSTTNSKGSLDCCLAHDCIVEKKPHSSHSNPCKLENISKVISKAENASHTSKRVHL